MSDNKETVQIVIDDSGVATQVRRVASEINKIGDSADKANKSLEGMGSKVKPPQGLKEVSQELGYVAVAAKMTGAQVDELQKRMDAVSSKRAMENALKELARNADLSASEVKKLAKEIGIADRSMKEFANSMGPKLSLAMKAGIAGAVGASVMLLKSFIANTIEAEQAQAQLQAALRSTGEAAGFSQTKLNEMANQMAKTTTYSVSEITKAQTVMTTYSNVVGDNFTRAMQVVADQSSRLGISMQQSAEMIGRAIDVPAEGMNSLVRQGFRFTQAQKDIVKELQETGRVMEAQGYVLDALEESYGGSADAARNTFGGALQSLKSAIEDITTGREGSFSAATDGVNAFADALRDQGTRDAINELIGLVGQLASGLASIAKYATLRSVSATFGEGAALAKKGLIDWDEFKSASFMVRQEMVDAVQDTAKIAGKHAGAIWQQFEKEGMAAYNQFTYQTEDLFEQSRRKANETLKAGLQTQREALDEQYEFLKKHADDKAGVEKWYQEQVAKLDAKGSKQHIATAKKTTQSLKELYAALFQDVDPRTQMEFETYLKEAEEAAKEKLKLEEKLAEEALKIQEDKEKEGLRIMERIQDATADIFYDLFQDIGKGWDKLWQSMKNWALRMMAELAAKAAMTKIAMPIVMTLTGAGTAQAAMQAVGGLGQAAGGMPGVSNLLTLGSGGGFLGGITSAINQWGASTFPSLFAASHAQTAGALKALSTSVAHASPRAAESALALSQTAPQFTFLQGLGGLAGLGGGIYQMTRGGTGNLIGGAGTAIAGGMMFTPAAPFAPLVAIGSQILGGLFGGKKEHSPSVIFQAQEQAWGDLSNLKWHTKSGADKEMGQEISKTLQDAVTPIFAEVENLVGAFGDQYVEELKKQSVYFGRGWGSWSTWDFGTDHDFEELFEKAVKDVRGQILKAAAPTLSRAGQEYLASENVQELLGMFESPDKLLGQFTMLQGGIPGIEEATKKFLETGKDKGFNTDEIERYVAELQALQQVLAEVALVWGTIKQASTELVTPLTQYEAAQRAINIQYDEWVAQLEALGIATAKINEIEADRETLLDRLYQDSQKAIADILRSADELTNPLTELEKALRDVDHQFDEWMESLRQLGASIEQITSLEAQRSAALANTRVEFAQTAYTTAQDTQSSILGQIVDTYRQEAQAKAREQSAAYSQEISSLDAIIRGHEQAISAAKSALRAAYDREAGELKDRIKGFDDLAEAIRQWQVDTLAGLTDTATIEYRAGVLRTQYQEQTEKVRAGDVDAWSDLSEAATGLVEIGRDSAATREDYLRTIGLISADLETTGAFAEDQKTIAERQLDALEKQASTVLDIVDSQQSFAEAFANYNALMASDIASQAASRKSSLEYQKAQVEATANVVDVNKIMSDYQKYAAEMGFELDEEQLAELRKQLEAMLGLNSTMDRLAVLFGQMIISQQEVAKAQKELTESQKELALAQEKLAELEREKLISMGDIDVPKFASGGTHYGGLRLVGERGPEIESTGASRIWNAEETRDILMGGGQSVLVLEIAQLRADLQSANYAIAKNTADTSKMLRRWDGDGMPEERAI